MFSISDNGMGIDPAHQEKVFELFHRVTSHQLPGSGIGLATCKKIVECSGGKI